MKEESKSTARKIAGLCLSALTVFIFLAIISYLFHWKQDMSLVPGGTAANAAGSFGYRTGRLLVCECLGLGSFALLVILTVLSERLLVGRWRIDIPKCTVLCITGAVLASLLLAFISEAANLQTLFGGGLGGRCSDFIILWCIRKMKFFTPVALVLLSACWLVFGSKRFSAWLDSLSESGKEKEIAEEDVEEEIPEPESHSLFKPEMKPVTPVMETPAEIGDVQRTEQPEDSDVLDDKPAEDVPFEIIEDDTLNNAVKKDLRPIDNRLDPPDGLPRYRTPSLDLLMAHSTERRDVSSEELQRNNNKIRTALGNYKIQIEDVKAIVGPTVTLYKVYPAPGVQISQIKRLQEDIAMSLRAKGVRVVTLDDSVGIEVANDHPSIVPLKSLLNDSAFRESKAELPVALGYTITQKVKVFDLADAPHLLIAGATKQGKSVGLNVIVSSLLYSKHPSELKFVFIDPKMVEFSSYGKMLHHYLAVLPDAVTEEDEMSNAIVKKPKDAEKILRSICTEMDERYELLSKAAVNKITLYNEKYCKHKLRPDHGHRFLPYLVVVVDEYADLTMTVGAGAESKAAGRSITNSIIRLAQKGRAAGIHVILATQRPSVDVISGLIKSNFPMRIAFRVASRVDSQTILDTPGAEKLIGKGDMLWSAGIDSERIQCGYVSGDEIECITDFIGEQKGFGKSYNTPYYLPSAEDSESEGGGGMTDISDLDERFAEAAELVVTTQKASTSYLQTRLGMGFAKAARVMGQLESAGIVGPQEGAKPRQVLIPDLNSLKGILDAYVK